MTPLLLISIALSGYAGLRLLPALSDWPIVAALLAIVLVICALSVPAMVALLRGARRQRGSPASAGAVRGDAALTAARTEQRFQRLMSVGSVVVGFTSSLLVLTLLRDAVLALWQLASWLLPPAAAAAGWSAAEASLATLRQSTALAVPALAGAASLLGWYGARRTAPVRTVEIPIADLPAALEGFSIVQISDIHVGNTIGADYVSAIVDRVNALGADLVAITGDLVDGSVAELADGVAPLARLRSREGSFFVTGNHEYYSGVGPWLVELRRLGIDVLSNRHVVIERNGAKLVLGGVTDYSAGHFDPAQRSDPAAALRGAPADAAVRVLLAHQPRTAPAAAEAGFDLQLSGHTHGGQFLPWKYLVRLQQPYTAGLHRLGAMWIYISRGTGYWGPPMRLGAPSEITRVTLTRSSPAAR